MCMYTHHTTRLLYFLSLSLSLSLSLTLFHGPTEQETVGQFTNGPCQSGIVNDDPRGGPWKVLVPDGPESVVFVDLHAVRGPLSKNSHEGGRTD